MSWEDQGRQYHMWFGSGHAPPKLKTAAERAAAPAPDSLPAKLTAVAHGAVGALRQRSARAMAEAQLRNGVLPRLTEAMSAWAQGSRMDAQSFAHRFFDRDADDPVVTSLRGAASAAAMATTQAELGTAATQPADAMTAVGLDHWQHFVAHAVERARDPKTLAAVASSLQPAPRAVASGGTQLAVAAEGDFPGEPAQTPEEGSGPIPGPGECLCRTIRDRGWRGRVLARARQTRANFPRVARTKRSIRKLRASVMTRSQNEKSSGRKNKGGRR